MIYLYKLLVPCEDEDIGDFLPRSRGAALQGISRLSLATMDSPQMQKLTKCVTGASSSPSEEPLIAACRWFDHGCAGYIRDEDLEEIAFMVCNDISSMPPQPCVLVAHILPNARDPPCCARQF